MDNISEAITLGQPEPEASPASMPKEIRTSSSGIPYEFFRLPIGPDKVVKVIFKAREEIIEPDVFQEDDIVFTGEHPTMLKDDVYSKWKQTVRGKATTTGEPREEQEITLPQDSERLFIANRSAEGLLGLVLAIDPNNAKVKELLDQATQFTYSDELLGLIDQVVATRFMTLDGQGAFRQYEQ